ncbi:MAG: ABC transporter permease [Saprospirales bacterium]|nr:ABC transporter permease [Saprospirales bacterium]
MNLLENIRMALRSIRSNMMRSILTLLIIAFGIMALVGILTAIDSAVFALNDSISSLGANSFSISPSGENVQGHQGGRQEKRGDPISYQEALDFKQSFSFPAQVSVSLSCTNMAALKYGEEKTNPNVQIFGVDENYLDVKGRELEIGRNFTALEAINGGNRVIIGKDIVDLLFEGKTQKALNQVIIMGSSRYQVIGILKSKGASMNQSEDRQAIIPLLTGKRFYGAANTNYDLMVAVNNATDIDYAVAAATGQFRNIRKLKASEENDFEIFKSESLIGIIKENTTNLRMGAVAIGLMTLLGAAIGLMNIMLVSVAERTREIGVCKAIGANRRTILIQFLTEAVVICQLGGLVGIVLGILIGNIISILMGSSFLVPWGWIVIAIVTCLIVGLSAGIYPAIKASKLDPIEALRYE